MEFEFMKDFCSLEKALRSYATLTKGDTIKVNYLDKDYLFDVLEVKPENPANAISIVETDVQVDFAPPLDYVEPVTNQPESPVQETPQPVIQEAPKNLTFSGQGYTLSGKPAKNYNPPKPVPVESKPEPAKVPSDQIVFHTRDLRSSGSQPALRTSDTIDNPNLRSSSQTNIKKRRKRGEPEEPTPEPKKTFVPFSGTGFSLKSG